MSQIRLCRREGLRSLSCQSLLTFLPLLPWPGVRGWENREHELTRGEWRGAKGGDSPRSGPIGQPTQGVNVDKLGLYSPAERASRTRKGRGKEGGGDDDEEEKGPKGRERGQERCVCVCVEKGGKRATVFDCQIGFAELDLEGRGEEKA